MKKPVFFVVGTVLIAAIAVQVYAQVFVTPEQTKTGALDDLISADVPGWTTQDLPLAETEELRNMVASRLRFDDAISRVYRQGTTDLILYVAYWTPGKEPIRLVQNHTPDRCWVSNGWTCLDEEYAVTKKVWDHDITLKPAEWRIFEHDRTNDIQHVLFWHVAGEDVVVYRRQAVMDRTAAIKDLFRFGLDQRREQFFVRISSNVPLETIWDDPGVAQIVKDLADLCLLAPSEAAGSEESFALNAN